MTKEEMNEIAEIAAGITAKKLERFYAPLWTLAEASEYSHIGINRLRVETLKDDCPYVIWVGETKRLIRVDAFRHWLNATKFVA